MNRRQLRVLFFWYLMVWITIGALLSLLPVHARNLGAEPGVVGSYMAFAYVMIATGSLSAGWLCRRLGSRRACAIVASAGMPVGTAGMALATTVWQLAAATGLVWLCLGVMGVVGSTLTGLRASRDARGSTFGILGITQGLGKIISGITLGPVADRYGYRGMFALASALGLVLLAVALLIRDVESGEPVPSPRDPSARMGLGWRYWVFLGAIVLISMSSYAGNIARALVMRDAGFAATAIASVASIGALVILAVQPAAGWLSDRLGRRGVMVAAYLAGAVSLLVMSVSSALWHYWVAVLFENLTMARQPAQRALVADTLPPTGLSRGMAYLAAARWIGGIIGYGVSGGTVQALGGRLTMQAAALLPLLGIGMLLLSRAGIASAAHERVEDPAPQTGAR